MSLRQEDIAKIVDTSIAVVRKIEIVERGHPPIWLHNRAVDGGCFPSSVFE